MVKTQKIRNREDLIDIVERMENQPVLVVGDIMLDRFIYGHVDRISPESPVPVLTIKREDRMLGGAGNALASLAGLKTRSIILSVIGNDEEGRILRNKVEELGYDSDGLLCDSTRPTTVKSRFLAGHQQLLRADFEKKQGISTKLESDMIEQVRKIIPSVRAVLISDYGKGVLSAALLRAIIDTARRENVKVVVDPKGKDYKVYSGASAVTPNRKELSEATDHSPTETDDEIIEAARSVIKKCDIDCIFATRSKDGMSIIQKGDTPPAHLRTEIQEVFDVSGAGDVVIATITAALAAGADMIQAGALANVSGGIAVSKVGTTPIRAEELVESLHDDAALHKIQPTAEAAGERTRQGFICTKHQWEEASEHVKRWRARGLKVGFTNGCFDILHYGHVSYLNQARAECDRLIVGLNVDSSVRALKGPERPVHDELSRAAVLGALGSVDMVVLFGGDTADADQTANAVIEKLHPDIYFKGGDYKVDDIPETPIVRAYGGEVKVLSVFEGHSTTASIAKMRSRNKAA